VGTGELYPLSTSPPFHLRWIRWIRCSSLSSFAGELDKGGTEHFLPTLFVPASLYPRRGYRTLLTSPSSPLLTHEVGTGQAFTPYGGTREVGTGTALVPPKGVNVVDKLLPPTGVSQRSWERLLVQEGTALSTSWNS
jgi:hypothetical protein